jgi:hypothetical protein
VPEQELDLCQRYKVPFVKQTIGEDLLCLVQLADVTNVLQQLETELHMSCMLIVPSVIQSAWRTEMHDNPRYCKLHQVDLWQADKPLLGELWAVNSVRSHELSAEQTSPAADGSDPVQTPQHDTDRGVLILPAKVAGAECRVMFDTGASICFVSNQWALDKCLPTVPAERTIITAGADLVQSHNKANTTIQFQHQEYPISLWVIPQLPGPMDAVIGCDWLGQHGAVLHVQQRKVLFPKATVGQDITPCLQNTVPRTQASNLPDSRTLPGLWPQPATGATSSEDTTPDMALPLQEVFKKLNVIDDLLGSTAKHAGKQGKHYPMSQLQEQQHRTLHEAEYSQLYAVDLYGRELRDEMSAMDLGPTGPEFVPHTELRAVLTEFSDVFPIDLPKGLPPARGMGLEVFPLKEGTVPKRMRQYRLSPVEREELQRQVSYLEDMGWVQESTSSWAHPVTFASKGEGQGLRCCIDLRAVNSATRKYAAPIPRMDELIDSVAGTRIMSSLDLAAGYHQIPLIPEERERTAFHCGFKLMEYTVMPFGATNAPAVFSRFMHKVLEGFIGHFVLVYLDDVLIISRTPQEHLEHLRKVFQRFRLLYCRPHKCKFNRQELPYLGHILTVNGARSQQGTVGPRLEMSAGNNQRG